MNQTVAAALAVNLVDVNTIKPYEHNPRKNDRAVRAVSESIKAYGFQQPIVVDDSNVIIVGHTRWRAALLLGLKQVPVHVAVGMSPVDARAYRIADNKTNELSDWNSELLVDEVRALSQLNVSLMPMGFTVEELNRMLAADPLDGVGDPEWLPDLADEVAQPGQVWLLGKHRVVCSEQFTMQAIGKACRKLRPKLGVLLADQASDLLIRSAGVDVLYAWHASLDTGSVARQLASAGYDIRAQVIWSHGAVAGTSEYGCSHSPSWYAVKRGAKAFWGGDRKQSTIWNLGPAGNWPVDCVGRPARNHGGDGDAVYVPGTLVGAGVVACEKYHRVCVGVARAADVNVAIARWEHFTGEKSKLEA